MKFILDNILAVSIALASGLALLLPALLPRGKRASPQQVVQLINRGKTVLVDIRTPEEFAAGHLRDAKNIPLADLPSKLAAAVKNKGLPLILVCQSGVRSGRAVAAAKTLGYDQVHSLGGGLAAWKSAGLPLEKV